MMSDGAYFSATALTIVLVASGWAKLRAPLRFRHSLSTFKVIPTGAAPALVVLVPLVELALAALQWVPSLQPGVNAVMVTMLVAFTALLLQSLLSGEQADCGCFGSSAPERVSWFSIVRNLVLIGLAVMGLVAGDGVSRGALPAAMAGLGCGVLILVLDQGISLLAKTSAASDRFGS